LVILWYPKSKENLDKACRPITISNLKGRSSFYNSVKSREPIWRTKKQKFFNGEANPS
jgi:hypothetical protein